MELSDSITVLKGVGPELAKKFAKLGLKTLDDLIEYFPRKYEDYSDIQPVGTLEPGDVTIRAAIEKVTGRYVRRGMHITEAIASD